MFLCIHLLLLSIIFSLSNIFPLPVLLFAPKLFLPHRFYYYFQSNYYLDHERFLSLLVVNLMLAQWQGLFKVQFFAMMV